jgi:hypothetical protein
MWTNGDGRSTDEKNGGCTMEGCGIGRAEFREIKETGVAHPVRRWVGVGI